MKILMMIGLLFSLFASIVINSVAAAEELPLVTGEWPPYASEQMDGYGIGSELVSAIVKEMGMIPKYSFFPWKRGEMMTKGGEVFGTFPYKETPERLQEFDFSDKFLPVRVVFFYNKQKMEQAPSWKTLEDLRPYRIGGISGYSYIPEFDRAGLKVDHSPSTEAMIKLLFAGRVDLIIDDEMVGWHMIRKLYPQEAAAVGVLEKPHHTSIDGLMISRDYPNARQLLDRFNQALQRIKDQGIYQEILRKHEMTPPSP